MLRIASSTAGLLAILVLGACTVERAPDTEGRPPPGDAFVIVELDEFSIDLPDSVSALTVSFQIENAGEMEHSFAIEGPGVAEEIPEPIAPGESFVYTTELQAGTYTIWCPIGDHRGEGMEAAIEATDGPAASEEGAPLEGVDPGEQEPIDDEADAP